MKNEKVMGINYLSKIILHDNSPPYCKLYFITKNLPIMKNLILFFVLLLFKNADAQLNKGIWLVGGTGSFYSYNEDYSTPAYSQTAKYRSIDVVASIGYFISDKFTAGLRPIFSSYKGKVVNTPGGTSQIKLSVGPFVRYYFLNKDNPFNILFDASYQLGINKFLRSPQEEGKFNTLSIMGGSEIFFNSSVGLEILFGYTSKVLSIDNSQSASNNTKKGFQTSIGFTFHLEKL